MAATADTGTSAAAEVAAMLDILAAVDLRLAEELDRIAASPVPVGRATVRRLEDLLAVLRPAVQVREAVAAVPSEMLGAAIRLRRRRAGGTR